MTHCGIDPYDAGMAVIEAETEDVQAGLPPGALAVENGIAWLRLDDPGFYR